MRCICAPAAFDCLERSQALQHLLHTLKDTCAERWLELRKRRQQRKKRESYTFPQDRSDLQRHRIRSLKEDLSLDHQIQPGQSIDVRVMKKEGQTVHVETVEGSKQGRFRLPSSAKPLRVLQIISVYVVGVDHDTQELILSLDLVPQTNHCSMTSVKQHSTSQTDTSSTHKQTIDRLNSLFSLPAGETHPKDTSMQHLKEQLKKRHKSS